MVALNFNAKNTRQKFHIVEFTFDVIWGKCDGNVVLVTIVHPLVYPPRARFRFPFPMVVCYILLGASTGTGSGTGAQ